METLLSYGMQYQEPNVWDVIPDIEYQDDSWVIWDSSEIYLYEQQIELVAYEVIYCN